MDSGDQDVGPMRVPLLALAALESPLSLLALPQEVTTRRVARTAEADSLTGLEARNPNLRCQQGLPSEGACDPGPSPSSLCGHKLGCPSTCRHMTLSIPCSQPSLAPPQGDECGVGGLDPSIPNVQIPSSDAAQDVLHPIPLSPRPLPQCVLNPECPGPSP